MKVVKLFLRAVLCGVLPLCLLGGSLSVAAYAGSAPQAKTAGANLRVMSYNVLVDNDKTLGGWDWGQPLGNRGDKASACIAYYQPDVIGFQECNYKWHVSLKDNLKDYAFVNADVPEVQPLEKAESLGKKDWMCTTMMYNKKTLKLIQNELVGYSVNYWGCIQRMRYASMAVFEIKATGERFTFFSTHLDAERDAKGQQNRLTQTGELVEVIKRYKSTYGYPVIGTGDFNSGYSDPPIQNVVNNAGMTSDTRNRGGIDYVLYSAGVQSKYFTVVSDNDVAGASDHKPVFADLKVEKYAFPTTKTTESTTSTTSSTTKSTARPTTESDEAGNQGFGVVIARPTAGEQIEKPIAGNVVGDNSTTKRVTTGSVVSGTDTTATVVEPTDNVSTTPTQSQEGNQEETTIPEDTQESTTTQIATLTVGEEEEGISAPMLALIGFGGVLGLFGIGIGIYLLLSKKK